MSTLLKRKEDEQIYILLKRNNYHGTPTAKVDEPIDSNEWPLSIHNWHDNHCNHHKYDKL